MLSIQLNRYFGDFLVVQAKQNDNSYPSYEDAMDDIIEQ
jgi:hypothetical protein